MTLPHRVADGDPCALAHLDQFLLRIASVPVLHNFIIDLTRPSQSLRDQYPVTSTALD